MGKQKKIAQIKQTNKQTIFMFAHKWLTNIFLYIFLSNRKKAPWCRPNCHTQGRDPRTASTFVRHWCWSVRCKGNSIVQGLALLPLWWRRSPNYEQNGPSGWGYYIRNVVMSGLGIRNEKIFHTAYQCLQTKQSQTWLIQTGWKIHSTEYHSKKNYQKIWICGPMKSKKVASWKKVTSLIS